MADIQYVGHAILETTRFPRKRNGTERKLRSTPSHVEYEVNASENNFHEKVTAPNLKDSGVIYNAAGDSKNKVVTREFAVSIAKNYMRKD